MSSIFIYAVLLMWFAYVLEINGSVIFGINFTGTTGLLWWTGFIALILVIFAGINSGYKEKELQEFQKFMPKGKIEK